MSAYPTHNLYIICIINVADVSFNKSSSSPLNPSKDKALHSTEVNGVLSSMEGGD